MSSAKAILKSTMRGFGSACEIVRLFALGLAVYFLLLAAWKIFSEMFFGDTSDMFFRSENVGHSYEITFVKLRKKCISC